MKKIVVLFALLLMATPLAAQVFGGNPPSLKWRQINNDTVRIIFPEGMETQAQQVAATVLYLNKNKRASIGNREKKADMVFQNQNIYSNGFVTLGPFHSVFETTPPASSFSLGATDWLYELSLHEYRHVLQNMNFRSGIGKTFSVLFGDYGQAFITNSLIPDWFWEGDAVFMETALSRQGRGRLPSFLETFRGMSYQDKAYKYPKVRNGSLKDRVPDHYPLGYMMVSYGRERYGKDFWKKITQESLLNHKAIQQEHKLPGSRPFHWLHYDPYPLSAALKYHTGSSIPRFYKKAFQYYSRQWKEEQEKTRQTKASDWKLQRSSVVTDYTFPHYMPDGSVLALKSAYNHTPVIVKLDSSGAEEKITAPGMLEDPYFSYAGQWLTWTELRFDPRWAWKNYSVIKIYDLATKRTRTITKHSRYFSPDISADGKYIIAHEVSDNQQYHLVLLDARDGKLLKKLPNPNHWFYTFPKFCEGNKAVLSAVRNSKGEMALIRQNIHNDSVMVLTPFTLSVMGQPVATDHFIFFPASYLDNRINIYAVRIPDKKMFRVTERWRDDYSLAVDSVAGQITFSEFSLSGYGLKKMKVAANTWHAVDTNVLRAFHNPYVPTALQQEGGPVMDKIPARRFTVSRYHPLNHLLRVHSWSLLPSYPDPGIFLQSQDVLNTLQATLGGGYNFDEKSPFIRFGAAYGGIFPVLQLNAGEQFHRQGYTAQKEKFFWNETSLGAGFHIPLNLSSGHYTRSFTIGSNVHWNRLHFLPGTSVKNAERTIRYIQPYLQFSNALLSAQQEIYPRFGQTLSVQYDRTFHSRYAEQFDSHFNLFLPGLFRNHSFYVNYDWSVRDRRRQYLFTDNFTYSRGYNATPYREIYRIGLNYQLPVCYPDFGLNWAYLLRIRLHLFGDYTHAKLQPGFLSPGIYRSVGATLYFDTRLFNYIRLPIGVRYSYLTDKDFEEPGRKERIQLLVNLQLF